ncbi:MAG: rhomboid family intramembrane serine protease, partial [Sedimentisphaerales bacterium]|nr:rhomboid family intramembrane serine protease [Sedimentisphaerales bacterium]
MIPIGTNIWPRHRPYANYVLIALTVGVFLASYDPTMGGFLGSIHIRPWARGLMLVPSHWRIWQLATYAFLHDGLLHILGNMFFLYLFGNSVNDRLGHIGYLCLYLAGAAFSGLGHILVHRYSSIPTIGASGAVASITGAYLVFFPRSLVTVLYWFLFLFGTVNIPALWFIGLKMILLDNLIVRTSPFVAYEAHLAGYAFGIVSSLALLASGIAQANHLDLWSVIRQWNRRRRFRSMVAKGYDPFSGVRQGRSSESAKGEGVSDRQQEVFAISKQIWDLLARRDLAGASQAYLRLTAVDQDQII